MSTEPISILTKEGWDSYLQRNCAHIARRSSDKEFDLADLLLFCNRHPITGEVFSDPMGLIVVTKFTDRDQSKDHFALISRAMSVAGDAIASVYASEMWFSMVQAKTAEEMEELMKKQVAPGDDPNRKEGIVLQHEHRQFGHGGAMAIIDTDAAGKRTIGPWDREFGMQGRFSGIVAQSRIDDLHILSLMRTYLKRETDKGRISKIMPLKPEDIFN